MNYQQILQRVHTLDFVENRERADAMIKAVLGTLASRMRSPLAHQFANDLPEPLDYETLRGHQAHSTNSTTEQFFRGICSQFRLSEDHARTLVQTVLHCAKDHQPIEEIESWEQGLPADWVALLEKA